MLKTLPLLTFVLFLMTPSISLAIDYNYKKLADFKTLKSFKSVDAFESYYGKYVQECLDNTGGGTGGIACLISSDIWDRELNIYYKKLMNVLGKKEKQLLRTSQRTWIKERDQSIKFISSLLDIEYEGKSGTMYLLMRAGDADSLKMPIVKHRALQLRRWFEFYEKECK